MVTPGRKLNPYEQWAIQQKLESKTNFYNKIFKPYDGVGLPPLQIPLGAQNKSSSEWSCFCFVALRTDLNPFEK